MSSTNKTTNYELSQFIGTDKPAWLTDYNVDMGKIDAGVHTAQTTATGADGKATANATAIGTLANLTTTAKTDLVSAVNEVNTTATAASGAAGSAASVANTASRKVDSLAAYLTMSKSVEALTANMTPSSGTINRGDVNVRTDDTYSYGKVYGHIEHTPANTNQQSITLNIDTGIHPETPFSIHPAGLVNVTGPTNNQALGGVTLIFNTNGTLTVTYWPQTTAKHFIYFWPCFYVFTDFGDVES